MSVSDVGKRLLSEVVETTLDEVLRQFRDLAGRDDELDANDTVLDRVLHAHAVAQSPQPQRRPRLPVLEISSAASGAGKTQLLYTVIAKAVLPDHYGSVVLNGKHAAVVFFDTDIQFDVMRLVEVMTAYVQSKVPANKDDSEASIAIDEIIKTSLPHIHVFQPQNMDGLLEMLHKLKDYLFDSSAHASSDRAVHSIIIDNASAWYWETRAKLEEDQINALDAKAPGSIMSMPPPRPNPYTLLVNRLRSLQQVLDCAVIATSTATSFKDATTGEYNVRTLPAPWPSYPTARVLVKRQPVRKFDVSTSWEDAVKEKDLRKAAVDRGIFLGQVLGTGEHFTFVVDKGGVKLEGDSEDR